jgi:N utilization substance protein B
VAQNTRNWDVERVPLMDRVIMQVALAEITSFPSIPLSVSINEYIEIAKSYSTPNSARYINATLDNISKKLIAEHKLIKNA